MAVGTVFTLFVVPVFYSLIAADHRAVAVETEPEPSGTFPVLGEVAHA
jgi:multidrug efflux pump